MTNITLSIPEDIKKDMDKFPEINWSEIARAAIRRRIIIMKQVKEFTRDSEFTEEDSIAFGKKVNKTLAKKYR